MLKDNFCNKLFVLDFRCNKFIVALVLILIEAVFIFYYTIIYAYFLLI